MTDGPIQNLNGFSIGFFCSHSAHNVTDGPIQNLNGFSIGFFCSHSAHNVTDGPIQNLNGFSIGFFCSHSAHNVTDGPIQNLNGFSIGFFCSHSVHNVTDGRIQNLNRIFLFTLRAQRDGRSYTRLPTSVGLAQARPNYVIEHLVTILDDTYLMRERICCAFNNIITYICYLSDTMKYLIFHYPEYSRYMHVYYVVKVYILLKHLNGALYVNV